MRSGFVPRITGQVLNDGRENGVQTQVKGQFTNTKTGEVASGFSTNPRGEPLTIQEIQKNLYGEHVGGFKNGPQMCSAIKAALKNGNKVAITSFTLYPEVLLPALQMLSDTEKNRLTEQELSQIFIVGGFPSAGASSPLAKQEHILTAMIHFGITQNTNVMLVDDSEKNVTVARANGMLATFVPTQPDVKPSVYFEEINQFVAVGPLLRTQNANTADQPKGPATQRIQADQ